MVLSTRTYAVTRIGHFSQVYCDSENSTMVLSTRAYAVVPNWAFFLGVLNPTLGARGFSRALISLTLHTSYTRVFAAVVAGLRPAPTSHESVPRKNLWYTG